MPKSKKGKGTNPQKNPQSIPALNEDLESCTSPKTAVGNRKKEVDPVQMDAMRK